MNIKSLVRPTVLDPADFRRTERKDGVRPDRSHEDRDANGRQESGSQNNKRHLSEDELKKVVENLKNHPGVKANNLHVRLEIKDEVKVVYLEAADGKIVRRFSEMDLVQLLNEQGRPTGQIFDKAM